MMTRAEETRRGRSGEGEQDGLCQAWFGGAVDEFEEATEEMADDMVQDVQNKMDERMEEILNKSEAHLRSRVAGLKSILEKNKGDKKLLVALKSVMKRTSAKLSATNQAFEAVANLTDCDGSEVAEDVSRFFKDLQKHDSAWHMKGLLHSFNLVFNISPQELRKTESEWGHISKLLEDLQTQVTELNAKDIGDTCMAFNKLRVHLTGEMSLLIHSKIMNMETDGGITVGTRVALCSQLHGTNGTVLMEVDNLRNLGKKMKDENFLMKQQVDKEKRALDKVRRHKDQRLIGISTLIAFTISNLAFLFGRSSRPGTQTHTSIQRLHFGISPTI